MYFYPLIEIIQHCLWQIEFDKLIGGFFLNKITHLVAEGNSVDVKCLTENWVYDVVQHSMLIKRLECKINKERKVELFGASGAEGENTILE